MRLIDASAAEGAKRLTTLAANSLSAFAEVQGRFDPLDVADKP